MPGFRQVTEQLARKPARLLTLEPWVFADMWERKPTTPVCVGLRLMSEQNKSRARAEAEKIALGLHPRGGPNWTEAYNDALMRFLCAFSICDPNDVEKAHELLPMAEEEVRVALTSLGTRFIFDAVDKFETEVSPLTPEATDEELTELVAAMNDGALDKAPTAKASAARRFMRYALEELGAAE
jgi:hypothetical protein